MCEEVSKERASSISEKISRFFKALRYGRPSFGFPATIPFSAARQELPFALQQRLARLLRADTAYIKGALSWCFPVAALVRNRANQLPANGLAKPAS